MVTLLQNYWPDLLLGFKNTLLASVIALILSLAIGVVMGWAQTTRVTWLKTLANIYVELFRNIPLIIIVMFFYVAVPLYWVAVDGFTAGVIGLTIYTSAFMADNVRGGILAIPQGQREAGLSQGLTHANVMRYIILPQAVRTVLPPLGNQAINLVKNSSILAMVAGMDLMYYGDLIALETFDTFSSYILIGLFYLAITVPVTYANQGLERYFNRRY